MLCKTRARVALYYASIGPRSADRGNRVRTISPAQQSRLQLGRDQLIAEIMAEAELRIIKGMLQLGRDQLIAEMAATDTPVLATVLLQLGRDQLIAEMQRWRMRSRGCQHGFNWAAIS